MAFSPENTALGFGLSLSMGGVQSAFNPASLFGASDRGIIIDNTAATNLFQLSGGTTAVALPGDPIGYTKDLSPNAKNATQATASKRPMWWGMPRTLGTEVVTNGNMVSDASSWVQGTGWAWASSGKTAKTAGVAANLSQTVTLTVGQAYALWFSVVRTAGTVTPKITGGTPISFPARSLNMTAFEYFVATSGNNTIEFDADSSFAGSIGLVSITPILTFTNMGAYSDGVTQQLATPAIDMTGSHQGTSVVGSRLGWRAAAMVAWDVGSYETSVAGSYECLFNSSPSPIGRFANGTALNQVTGVDSPAALSAGTTPATGYHTFQLDFTQLTVSAQMQVRSRGLLPTQTPTSNTVADHALPNAAITLHSAPAANFMFGGLSRLVIINRTLNATEVAQAEAWVKQGMAVACILGDSTISDTNPALAAGLNYNFPVGASVGGLVSGSADYSFPGDKIDDQKTKLTNGGSTNIADCKVIIIQVGLNDCNTYGGGGTKTSAQIIADYQTLVDQANALKPAGCKVYVCSMNPARAWLGSTTTPATAYQAWLDLNASIAGTPNPGLNSITGVDARITGHVAALNDGSDNLAQQYNGNYDGVHESTKARFVVGQYWRAQLEADGLLLTS